VLIISLNKFSNLLENLSLELVRFMVIIKHCNVDIFESLEN